MNKFSISEFVADGVKSHQPNANRPEAIRNLFCQCDKCPRKTVTIRLADLPALATSLGFDDLVTAKEFNQGIAHKYFATNAN